MVSRLVLLLLSILIACCTSHRQRSLLRIEKQSVDEEKAEVAHPSFITRPLTFDSQDQQASVDPASTPTASPIGTPSSAQPSLPSTQPSATPTLSVSPSVQPSAIPTASPSAQPSAVPTASPSAPPSAVPTASPSAPPSAVPTASPSTESTVSPSIQLSATPTFATSLVPTEPPTIEPTTSPSLTPTISPTAVPTAAAGEVGTEPSAAPTLYPPEVPPDHPDQYSYGFVRYVYTGMAIVIVFGTLWYCCSGITERFSYGQYSMVSTNDVTELFPRPPSRNSAQLARDIELARFQRMAGGSNTYPNPFNRQ